MICYPVSECTYARPQWNQLSGMWQLIHLFAQLAPQRERHHLNIRSGFLLWTSVLLEGVTRQFTYNPVVSRSSSEKWRVQPACCRWCGCGCADRNEVSLNLQVRWEQEPSSYWEFRSESASYLFRALGKSPASQPRKLSVGTYLKGRCEIHGEKAHIFASLVPDTKDAPSKQQLQVF